jgi:hypothetical protein
VNWADLTTEQRAEAIRAGVAADKSGLTIGRELGVSRNVIIGWAHRNNIPLRRSLCVSAEAKHHKQGRGRKSAAKKFDPFTGQQRATRKYDFSPLTGMARPTIRGRDKRLPDAAKLQWHMDKEDAGAVAAMPSTRTPQPAVQARPLPEKFTSPPVLFRGRRMGFECSFIPGDPKHPLATCCGAPVEGLTEWCSWHLRIVTPVSGAVY